MCDIMCKSYVCEVCSLLELSQKTYDMMMALDDRVRENWVEFFFNRILEHMEKNSNIKETHKYATGLSFWLKISYILEAMLKEKDKAIDKGEHLKSMIIYIPPEEAKT